MNSHELPESFQSLLTAPPHNGLCMKLPLPRFDEAPATESYNKGFHGHFNIGAEGRNLRYMNSVMETSDNNSLMAEMRMLVLRLQEPGMLVI
jgi:hypothetical protein